MANDTLASSGGPNQLISVHLLSDVSLFNFQQNLIFSIFIPSQEKDTHYFPDPSALKLNSVDLLLSEILAEKDLIVPDGWCTIICDMEIHLSHRFSHEKKVTAY